MTRVIFLYGQDNRPRADIIVQSGVHKLHLFPIIDSGADFTTLPKGVGEVLNFEPPKRKEINKVQGIGGHKVKYVKRGVRIEIGDYSFYSKICWFFDDDGQPLLGRDIFEKFDILFKQNPDKKIIFESNKKKLKF